MFHDKYLPIIMEEIKSIRKKYGLSADSPICDYIFFILKNECILVEWPEDEQLDLDGFSTEKVVNGRLETIVYINSAKNKEKQNFCAAHELGHRHKLERQLRDAFPDDIFAPSTIESVMNRFAAELMMPANDFKVRSGELYKKCLGDKNGKEVIFVKKLIEAIVELMDFYYVPYRAVVIRLQEMDIISERVSCILQNHEKTSSGKNVIDAIIAERGITRLRISDRKVQSSARLENIRNILQKTSVTKYMTTNELKKYSQEMGIAEEDIKLSEDMKKIAKETIDIEGIN